MKDSELLRLAAKAAGLEISDWCDSQGKWYALVNDTPEKGSKYARCWNPLTDDGDALRLAVKLKLEITVGFDRTSAELSDSTANDYLEEVHDGDACAATRRVIVRVAADIGKAIS